MFLFPGWEFGLPAFAAVRDDQAGAVAAVGDDGGAADGVFRAGELPCLAVVAVAGQGPADGDDEPGVGVDDDLMVGRVPVVLRLLGNTVVAGGHQGAVHDQHGVHAEPFALLEGERGSEMVDDAVGCGLGHPEQRRQLAQGQVRPPVGGDQQHAVLQRQAPRPALADRIRTLASQGGDPFAELTRAQPSEQGYQELSRLVLADPVPARPPNAGSPRGHHGLPRPEGPASSCWLMRVRTCSRGGKRVVLSSRGDARVFVGGRQPPAVAVTECDGSAGVSYGALKVGARSDGPRVGVRCRASVPCDGHRCGPGRAHSRNTVRTR